MEVLNVRDYYGNEGNEKVHDLSKKGAKLRSKLMIVERGDGWYEKTVDQYWGNRK